MKMSLIFLLGLGMGSVLGLLVAPEPGRIMRAKIRDEADKIVDKMIAKKDLKKVLDQSEPSVVIVEERYTV